MKAGGFLLMLLNAFFFAITGCTMYVKPEKTILYQEEMLKFSGGGPVRVVVPENADKEHIVRFNPTGKYKESGVTVILNLNDTYRITMEHIEDTLKKRQVPISPDANRYLKFTVDLIQYEIWAGGHGVGAYMDFTIETSDGYNQQYRVQNMGYMGGNVQMAINGLPARAAEKIFQDQRVVDFIQTR